MSDTPDSQAGQPAKEQQPNNHNKHSEHKRKRGGRGSRGAPQGMFDDRFVNFFRMSGTVVAIDKRLSGAMVITIRTDGRNDSPVRGTDGERKLTSRFIVWIPAHLTRIWFPVLSESICMITVTGSMHGIVQMVDEREYLLAEMKGNNIRLVANNMGRMFGGDTMQPEISEQHDYSEDEA